MKLKQYFLPLLILIATGLTAFFIYEMFHNFESDNIVNVTANNNVIVNQVADMYTRDNSNISATNLTTSSTNSTTTILPNDSKGTIALVLGVTLTITLILIGVATPLVLKCKYGGGANIPESFEMQSIPAAVING